MRVRKKELGDWHNSRSEDREPNCSHYPVKSVARSMSMREQWLVKQRMAVSRNGHILSFSGVLKTPGTLSMCGLPSLCCTWLTTPKARATPTNSNAHMLPVGLKVIEKHTRHTLWIRTPTLITCEMDCRKTWCYAAILIGKRKHFQCNSKNSRVVWELFFLACWWFVKICALKISCYTTTLSLC